MAIDITVIRGYKDKNYFDPDNRSSGYQYFGGAGGISIPVHNQLTSLQGGDTNEYYHLTAAEHPKLSAWSDQIVLAGSDISQIKIDSIVEFSTDAGVEIENINITDATISTDSGTGNITLAPADDVVIDTTGDLAVDRIKKNVANYIQIENDVYLTGANLGVGVIPSGDFMVETAGGIGPSAGYTYSLGDTTKRWQSVFVEAVNLLSNDSGASISSGIFAGADDYLYIQSGSGITFMNTNDILNQLWVVNNSVSTNDWIVIRGSDIIQVVDGTNIWGLTSGGLYVDQITEAVTDAGVTIESVNITNATISTDSGTGNIILSPADDVVVNGDLAVSVLKKNGGTYITAENDLYLTGANLGVGIIPTGAFIIEVAGDIGPSTNNTRTLGADGYRWVSYYGRAINLLDIGGSEASGIFADASDYLYINSGSGTTVMALEGVNNTLWIIDDSSGSGSSEYMVVSGSSISMVVDGENEWALYDGGLTLFNSNSIYMYNDTETDRRLTLNTALTTSASIYYYDESTGMQNLFLGSNTNPAFIASAGVTGQVCLSGAVKLTANAGGVIVTGATTSRIDISGTASYLKVIETSAAARNIEMGVTATSAYIKYNYTSAGTSFTLDYSGVVQIAITGTYTQLNYSGTKRLETTNTGVYITNTAAPTTERLTFTMSTINYATIYEYDSSTGFGILRLGATTDANSVLINGADGTVYMLGLADQAGTYFVKWQTGDGEISYTSSDKHYKTNIKYWEYDSLTFLKELDLKTFDRTDGSGRGEIGWIAQDVEALMPGMVGIGPTKKLLIKDTWFLYHYHRGIQQLLERQETQEEKIVRLEKRVTELELLIN